MAYFPNGSAGEVLDNQCAECPVGKDPDAPCPVLLVQNLYNYKQLDKGNEKLREAMNLLVDEKGICQMRKVMLNLDTSVAGERVCPKCSGRDFAMRYFPGSTGFRAAWIQTCAGCGYEFEVKIAL